VPRLARLALAFALLAGLLLPLEVSAQAIEDRVRRLGGQLQCPVCEGQTVADSNSGLAGDMRTVIRQRIEAGDSDQQILDRFVASYGDGILVDPPKRGFTIGLWVGPFVLLLLGGLGLAWLARGWVRRGAAVAAPTTVAVDAPVLDELKRFREELGR
jgi:cytochrome c-type biogenesis protein CcmH